MSATPSDLEVLSWSDYGTASVELARQVSADGYRPDLILGIARGGLFLAGSLGYSLAVKNLFVMNVEYYTGIDERLDVPVVLPPYLDLVDLGDSKMLVVDDVADTGNTLKLVDEFCQGKVGEVRTAVLYQKPNSVVVGDYIWKRTDQWIDFPWSTDASIIDPG